MASEKQVAANRRNSAKSTGPKTDEGKTRARVNALKHGLTSGAEIDSSKESKLDAKIREWTPWIMPDGPIMAQDLKMAVLATLQIDDCYNQESARVEELGRIATEDNDRWENDRKLEAAELGKSLKSNPETVRSRLVQLPEGREWLIRAWQQLLVSIPEGGESSWTDKESNRMLDLLGEPRDQRARLIKLGPFADPKETREVILGEIEILESCRHKNELEDLYLRRAHRCGATCVNDKDLRLVRRYKHEALKRYERSMVNLGYYRRLGEVRQALERTEREQEKPEESAKPTQSAKPANSEKPESSPPSEQPTKSTSSTSAANSPPPSSPSSRSVPSTFGLAMVVAAASSREANPEVPVEVLTTPVPQPDGQIPSKAAEIGRSETKPISTLNIYAAKVSAPVPTPLAPKVNDKRMRKLEREARKRARQARKARR